MDAIAEMRGSCFDEQVYSNERGETLKGRSLEAP